MWSKNGGMQPAHRIAVLAVLVLLGITLVGCTNSEKRDGVTTGSAYTRASNGSYVPVPAEIAGTSSPPRSAASAAPGSITPTPAPPHG